MHELPCKKTCIYCLDLFFAICTVNNFPVDYFFMFKVMLMCLKNLFVDKACTFGSLFVCICAHTMLCQPLADIYDVGWIWYWCIIYFSPPPTTSALHQWKQKRAKIGSQCTWLSLQIHSLDKRIEKLDQINRKLKIERHASKVLNTEPCENRVNTELTSEKNGVIPLSSSTSSLDDQVMINHGCSRTSPVSYSYSHKYIKNTLLPEVKGSYKCHNLHSSLTCRLCVQTRSRGSPCAAADCLHETLDASYHSNLSYANGMF